MRFRLVPTDDKFFALFSQSATNVAQCARALQALLADIGSLPAKIDVVMASEREGDELTRTILHRLNSTFVTPFDREDIHALAEELDDVVDDMWAVADLLNVMHLDHVLPELKEQADVLVQMADATVSLMSKLERMNGVREDLDRIDRLESEGDAIYRRALAHLFSGEFPALEVLKWKDIIEAMEAALNTVEDISDVVESIVLKHA
jgi:predicted phosphate transport protein (TIGR00153 family)